MFKIKSRNIASALLGVSLSAIAACTTVISSIDGRAAHEQTLEQTLSEEYQRKVEKIKIKEIKDMIRFGEENGLDFTYSFSKVDLSNNSPVLYGVFVSSPYRIKNTIEYLVGPYFYSKDKSEAELFARRFKENGSDVIIYSTQFFESAPITKALLKLTVENRARIAFHEGFHDHSKKNKLNFSKDVEETIADYVGYRLALDFFKVNKPESFEHAKYNLDKWMLNNNDLVEYYDSLSKCYSINDSNCKQEMDDTKKDLAVYVKYCKKKTEIKYSCRINNAFFLSIGTYIKHFDTVANVLDDVPIKEYLSNPQEHNKKIISQINADSKN